MAYTHKPISPFPFAPQVARLVRQKTDQASVNSLAKDIWQLYLKGLPLQKLLRTYVDLSHAIDTAKVKAIGNAASTKVSNTLCQVIAFLHAMDSQYSWDEINDIEDFAEELRTGDRFQQWSYVKVRNLSHAATAVWQAREAAFLAKSRMPVSEKTLQFLGDHRDQFQAEIQRLFDEMLYLRKYGVKASYFNDYPQIGGGGAWVVWDSIDFQKDLGSHLMNPQGAVAYASLAIEKNPRDLRPERKEEVNGAGRIVVPFDAHFLWAVDHRGEFDLSTGYNVAPVRAIFEADGKDAYYDIIRAGVVLKLYDLLVPMEVAKQFGRPGGLRGMMQGMTNKVLPPFSEIRDLVIPRLRAIDDTRATELLMEEELERDDAETRKRNLARHEVINHIRKLPPGHRASVMSRRLALEELGLVLAENETYVRRHARGNGERITSHRQRDRNPQEATAGT